MNVFCVGIYAVYVIQKFCTSSMTKHNLFINRRLEEEILLEEYVCDFVEFNYLEEMKFMNRTVILLWNILIWVR